MNTNLFGQKHPHQIVFFDPGCASQNIGDEIISISARSFIEPLFPNDFLIRVSTHQSMSFRYRRGLNKSKYGFVLGSNLLKGKMLLGFRQWDVSLLDTLQIENLVLVGCGWQTYSGKTDIYSSVLYRRLLSEDMLHSVRDEYTKMKLNDMGIKNVINTGCATMWGLTNEHCQDIPHKKASCVITTITDYNRDYIHDKEMIEQLLRSYEKVYLWLQGNGDRDYAEELGIMGNCEIIPPRLSEFDEILKAGEIDYVGTRLHGGIRALQHKRRTIVVAIDNRAREMAKDFNIPIIERENISFLRKEVEDSFRTDVTINEEEISRFLMQFA